MAWPQVLEEAERLAGETAALERLRSRLNEIDRTSSVDVDEFDLANKSGPDLLVLIRECRERWVKHFHAKTDTPGIELLMRATSDELYQRRLMGQAPGRPG